MRSMRLLGRRLVVVGVRGVERRDRLEQLVDPAEAQVLRGRLEQLGRGHPAVDPLDLAALDVEQQAVELEQRAAEIGHGVHR